MPAYNFKIIYFYHFFNFTNKMKLKKCFKNEKSLIFLELEAFSH